MTSDERCRDCLFWDHRIEAEVDPHTGYCTVHEMMKADTSHCPNFSRRTREAEQRYLNQMYNDPKDYGDMDLDAEGF